MNAETTAIYKPDYEYGYKVDGEEHFIFAESRESALRYAANELAFQGRKSAVNVTTFKIIDRYEALGEQGGILHEAIRTLIDFFNESVAIKEQEHILTPKADWD
jgi:hypothetical protein